ncbi:acyl carrier protein [Nocardiopsis mwathae]|nr:acyl carrier protein [Nocardiopsis mwathae]
MLLAVAGADEAVDMDGGQVGDTTFAELGYDSLAVLELGNRIEQEYGVRIPDGELDNGQTMRDVVAYVNSGLAEGGP